MSAAHNSDFKKVDDFFIQLWCNMLEYYGGGVQMLVIVEIYSIVWKAQKKT